tara:strand:- start:412 stop:585 length:174 start_codon:yes stop_codon:yes gene_type:complete
MKNKYSKITYSKKNGIKYKTYHLANERKTTVTVQDEVFDPELNKVVKLNPDIFEKVK